MTCSILLSLVSLCFFIELFTFSQTPSNVTANLELTLLRHSTNSASPVLKSIQLEIAPTLLIA